MVNVRAVKNSLQLHGSGTLRRETLRRETLRRETLRRRRKQQDSTAVNVIVSRRSVSRRRVLDLCGS